MGTWGTGPFDNDAAADFLDLLNDTGPSAAAEVVRQAFDQAATSDYLPYDDAAAAVAAAAVIAYATGAHGPDALADLVEAPPTPTPELRQHAARALDRVLADNSELRDLWADANQLDSVARELHTLREILTSADRDVDGDIAGIQQ